jgi:hypothetical protein
MLNGLTPSAPALIETLALVAIAGVLIIGRSWDWLANASLMLAIPVLGVVAIALRTRPSAASSYPDYGITFELFAALFGWRLFLHTFEMRGVILPPRPIPPAIDAQA